MNSINHVICSSRIASRGIALSDSLSDELETSGSTQDQLATNQASSSSPIVSSSPFSRLKSRISGLWLNTVQRWPAVCHFPFIAYFFEFFRIMICTQNVDMSFCGVSG